MLGVEQRSKAEVFRALHRGPRALVLVNAWDAASARVLEDTGASAIATSSAGIAFTYGYPDGQKISSEEMLATVARIARRVKLPVTADVEGGYGDTPEAAARTASAVIAAGAVGINLEDAREDAQHPLAELPLQLESIAAVLEAARAAGVPMVLNARTDIYLKQVGLADRRYDAAVQRLAAFRDAGADCVFAPGVSDAETIGRLVRDLKCPLNILAGPGSPSVLELEKLGVARVSVGSSAMRATLGLVRRMAVELGGPGTYGSLQDAPSFADMQRLME